MGSRAWVHAGQPPADPHRVRGERRLQQPLRLIAFFASRVRDRPCPQPVHRSWGPRRWLPTCWKVPNSPRLLETSGFCHSFLGFVTLLAPANQGDPLPIPTPSASIGRNPPSEDTMTWRPPLSVRLRCCREVPHLAPEAVVRRANRSRHLDERRRERAPPRRRRGTGSRPNLTVVIAGAGHWIAEQAPEEMLRPLIAFLAPFRNGLAATTSGA
jgi:hypothetical protein